jgi:hypothetical protein
MKNIAIFFLLCVSCHALAQRPALLSTRVVYRMPLPSGFNFIPQITPLNNGGTYSTDYSDAKFDFSSTTTVTYYFNNSTGNDSNDGLSSGAPKKSIPTVITALNSSPPANGATFIIQTDYQDIFGASTSQINFDLVIKSDVPGTRRTLAKIVSDGITQVSEGSNVYSWSRTNSGGITNILDYSNLDGDGFPIRLTEVNSEAAVDACDNCYYRSSAQKIYFSLFNNRAPDSNVKGFRGGAVLFFGNDVTKVFAKDLAIYGGAATAAAGGGAVDFTITNVIKRRLYFSNCVFGYAFYGFKLWTSGPTLNNSIALLKDCQTIYNASDGNNYHNFAGSGSEIGPYAVEIDCIARDNGWAMATGSTTPNNNGSTIHDGGAILRINSEYYDNENRNIHDINDGTRVWMVNCGAGDAKNNASDDNSIDFVVGDNSVSQTTKAWMDACYLIGSSSLKNLRVNTGTVTIYKNMDFTGWDNVINGTLTED